jgi:serine/threonine-protein phosphatase 6 regulatory ankyrin repeat subunit B
MGGFFDGTALYDAVFDNDVNAVSLLLECGADPNKRTKDGRTPLHAATSSESAHALQVIKMLITHGASVNAKIRNDIVPKGCFDLEEGQTALHNAAGTLICNEDDFEDDSNIAAVKFLVEHGAKVNEKDAFGCTPLTYAMMWPSLDVMELLIEHDADVNIKNTEDGGTLLHAAAYNGWLDVVQLLVAHGANVHSRDFEGETPLHRAALGRHMDVVSFLVSHGADMYAASKRNKTPQDLLDEPDDAEPM